MSEKSKTFDFVHIETVFSSEHERNISFLSDKYNQPGLLKEKIRNLTKDAFNSNHTICGKSVLLKPNWVTHDRKEQDAFCLRTNDNLLLAFVEIMLEYNPSRILIGDAPIQNCNWNKLLSHQFLKSIDTLQQIHSIPIEIKDFRRVTFDPFKNELNKDRNPLSDYIIFDLEKSSYLEPISSVRNNFRVTNYDPGRLAQSHTLGVHKYCVTKELFNADVIISLPKVKTHQKTGITAALKNLVGINGDKDFLPHHRVGGQGLGGDCYPGKNILRRTAEYFLDCANKKQGKNIYRFYIILSKVFWRSSFPKVVHQLAAGWPGNDTSWRMVMDLNRIAVFGKKDGTIAEVPQRSLYSFCDGIIGGQGDGPLNPEPLPLGILCFTNNSAMNDICMATLMGFDFQKIALLKTAYQNIIHKKIDLSMNEKIITLKDLQAYSVPTLPPPAWVDYLSNT